MSTLSKRIAVLEQQSNSENAADTLLHHLGVLNEQMPSKVLDIVVNTRLLDDELIANLIAGAEKAMETGFTLLIKP